jgi:hypothetical protein
MSVYLKLTESDSQIERKINAAIAIELNKMVQRNSSRVEKQLIAAVTRWITYQPEMIELLNPPTPGSLNAQLGISDLQALISTKDIVNAVVGTIEIKISPISNRLKGGIEVRIQPVRMRELLGLPSGFTLTLGGPLHWLSWLLTEGTNTIIYGYSYVPDLSGRSGGGSMKLGGMWRIPPEYSGTLSDNFITRALLGNDKELSSILQETFR